DSPAGKGVERSARSEIAHPLGEQYGTYHVLDTNSAAARKGAAKPEAAAPAAAPAAGGAEGVPDAVRQRVERALGQLKDHAQGLREGRDLDRRFGGAGRYE